MSISARPITDDVARAKYLRATARAIRNLWEIHDGAEDTAILVEGIAFDFGIELDEED